MVHHCFCAGRGGLRKAGFHGRSESESDTGDTMGLMTLVALVLRTIGDTFS